MVPALRALDAAYPAAHITLVGAARARPLALRLRRYVDGYLEFPGFPGIPGPANLNALPGFFDQARAARFDLALQMQGSGELANPLIVGASPFCDNTHVAHQLEDAGASAIVMRSLTAPAAPHSVAASFRL